MPLNWAEDNVVRVMGIRPGLHGDQILETFTYSASTVLYTVPANTILLLTDWSIFTSTNSTGSGEMQLRNGANVVQVRLAIGRGFLNQSFSGMANALFYPIEVPETWDININTAGTITTRGYIHGILIDDYHV